MTCHQKPRKLCASAQAQSQSAHITGSGGIQPNGSTIAASEIATATIAPMTITNAIRPPHPLPPELELPPRASLRLLTGDAVAVAVHVRVGFVEAVAAYERGAAGGADRVAVLEYAHAAAVAVGGLGLRRGFWLVLAGRGWGGDAHATRGRQLGVRAECEYARHRVLLGGGYPGSVAAFDGDLPGDVAAAEALVRWQPAGGV